MIEVTCFPLNHILENIRGKTCSTKGIIIQMRLKVCKAVQVSKQLAFTTALGMLDKYTKVYSIGRRT